MNMNIYPVLLTTVTFLTTLLGGRLAARYRNRIGVLAAFASGVLIAVPLFDILPETLQLAVGANVSVDNIMLLTAVGFIFLYALDRHLILPRSVEKDQDVRLRAGGVFATSELSAHSFLDGVAIGLGFQFDLHVGIIVAVAVISHDFSDGLSAFTIMLNSGNSLRDSTRMLFLDAVTPILGAVITVFAQIPQYYIVLFLPFFAGGFLYLGASDLLPQAEKDPRLITLLLSIFGFILIFVLARLLNI
jgi:zinc transporter ZupT